MIHPRIAENDAPILTPQDAQRLAKACPDLHEWPKSWHFEPADIDVGLKIVDAFVPFLLHMLDQGLAKSTLRRHRDNLWLLGGELIRRRYDDEELARKNVRVALCHLIDAYGGPLLGPSITESEQDSLDATCRKLSRFMTDSRSAH